MHADITKFSNTPKTLNTRIHCEEHCVLFNHYHYIEIYKKVILAINIFKLFHRVTYLRCACVNNFQFIVNKFLTKLSICPKRSHNYTWLWSAIILSRYICVIYKKNVLLIVITDKKGTRLIKIISKRFQTQSYTKSAFSHLHTFLYYEFIHTSYHNAITSKV